MNETSTEFNPPNIDLREYYNVILKRKWIVFAIFVLAVTLVGVFTLRQQKIYQAVASVIIEPYAPQVLGNVREVYTLGAGSYWSNQEYYNTQIDVLKSRTVAQKVVSLLRLEGNKDFLGIEDLSSEQQQTILDSITDYAELVQAQLDAELGKDRRTAYIKANHASPKWAQRIANAAVNAYIDFNRQNRFEVTQDAAGWLATQAQELRVLMDESEKSLLDFMKENQILSVSLEDRQNITSQRLQDLNLTLSRVQTERFALEARRNQILDIKNSQQPLDTIEKVLDSSLIQNLKAQYVKHKELEAELSVKYKPDHPKYQAIGNKIELYRTKIDQEIDNVLASMEREYKAKAEAERSLQRELQKVKNEAQDINEKAVAYNRLKRVSDNYTSLYSVVLKRQKEATLASHQETNNVYKLDSAIEPLFPIYPRVRLNLVLSALIGILLGIGMAFFLEYLDNTIKNQEDVEKYLEIPFLGMVPSIKLESSEEGEGNSLRDHYLTKHPKSAVAECCRTVRTNILFMSPEKPTKKILVTSAGPQEGKSTTVINLGITMAQSGSKILLLDTDMRRPRLHKSFDITSTSGLTTAILGEAKPEEVIQPSGVAGLDLVPCGPIPPNPTELIHTERFSAIIDRFALLYDRIIFDSPPLLMVTDPVILARMLDGVILVIRGGQASRDAIRKAIKQLKDVQARILGAVVNDLDISSREYGYYYYRQYGYYYGEKDHDESSNR